MNRRQRERWANCHPDRDYYARGYCSACYQRYFRRTHPGHRLYMKEYLRRWQKAHPDRRQNRQHSPEQKAQWRLNQRLRKYGLTLKEYRGLLQRQNNACAICRAVFTTVRPVHIDHEHGTGQSRGLLCNGCNSGLGYFGENTAALRRAAQYLEEWRAKPVQLRLIGSATKTDTINRMVVAEEKKP